MGSRVKVEISRYFDDKYHGRIAIESAGEWLILCRKHPFAAWTVESCGDMVIYQPGEAFEWFPVRADKEYDPFGKFNVKVTTIAN